MAKFHPLRIRRIIRETDDTVSVSFNIPEELQSEFGYTQGQYLTLRAMIEGQDVRRSYSLCSSPLENEWKVAIKKVEGGLFSTYANEQLHEGDVLDVLPPLGNFHTPLDPAKSRNYVAFAAGSGITPVISIIKTVLRTEPKSSFTLFFGNRFSASIIFKEEIESLKNLFMDRFIVYYLLTQEKQDIPLFNGRIDEEKCMQLCSAFLNLEAVDEFFLCGPEEMILDTKNVLMRQGVEERKIHFELFTTPSTSGALSRKKPPPHRDVDPTKQCMVTIRLDGKTFSFPLRFGGENILDAALHEGADLPYSCKGGVCCTCRAKLTEGEVDMDENYSLEQDEIREGYILTCQSHPRTEMVFVDFDVTE